jgi:hypothetical protein
MVLCSFLSSNSINPISSSEKPNQFIGTYPKGFLMQLVYVLSKLNKPLMPTNNFGKVRRLLKAKKAKIVQHKPFTIQLMYNTTEFIQLLTLGVDVGTKHIGVAVVNSSGDAVFLGEIEIRTKEVTNLMEKRKLHRHSRRKYCREKQKRRAAQSGTAFIEKDYFISGYETTLTCKQIKPGIIKFSNRKRTEKWLTPTCNHLLNTHINFVKKILTILPITKVVIEYAKFDIHKLINPNIKGEKYQNGRMKGYTNTQEYVLCRDKHTCQMCKHKTGPMHAHHVIWRSNGGSDTPENLITLCEKCHTKAHTNSKFNDQVVELFKGLKKRFTHATILNSIMPKFYEWLENKFKEIAITYGYETKDKRHEFNLEKTHWMDAYLISIGDLKPSVNLVKPFQYKQFRRHNKANITRQEERRYYLDGKRVALNRNKRTGQLFDSLKDLVEREGQSVLNKLTVKHAIRPKRSIKPFGMGDVVKYQDKFFTVKGYTGSRLGFIGEEKYNKPMSKSKRILQNQGICCI